MARMGTEKKGKQRECKRGLGRKLVIQRQAEALGKPSLVLEAKTWESRKFVLQHNPRAEAAQEQLPGAPSHTWHTSSCSQPIPHPPLLHPCSRARLRDHRAAPPHTGTTPGSAELHRPAQPTLAKVPSLQSWTRRRGAGFGSCGKCGWMHPKKRRSLIPADLLVCTRVNREGLYQRELHPDLNKTLISSMALSINYYWKC